MPKPGDVVTVDFAGATGLKRRPAVVLSNDQYHQLRPDLILGVITSNTNSANTPFDHVLADWSAAGLRVPSAFRAYFGMAIPSATRLVGQLSDRDWQAVRECIRKAVG